MLPKHCTINHNKYLNCRAVKQLIDFALAQLRSSGSSGSRKPQETNKIKNNSNFSSFASLCFTSAEQRLEMLKKQKVRYLMIE
jgi:hypothetical protein